MATVTSGFKLPNGATVIRARKLPDKPGRHEAWTVLAQYGREFVTWTYVVPDNSTGATSYCVHGHYFRDFEAAEHDYVVGPR